MHIRIYGIPACGPLKRLPPTQTRDIPGCRKQNTGGSDALCLGPPLVSGWSQYQWPKDAHPSKSRMNLKKEVGT